MKQDALILVRGGGDLATGTSGSAGCPITSPTVVSWNTLYA